MRIPVFPRGSNPNVHKPILRKSLAYCLDQVNLGNVAWVDRNDRTKGVICLGTVYFGEREHRPAPKFVPREYQHHIEPRIERIPQMDRLVAEWACAVRYWNEA
jgi:hypothetical protein